MRRMLVIIFFFFVFFQVVLLSQDQRRVSVLPLQTMDVPKNLGIITSYFIESSLIRSGYFSVISNQERDRIIEEQEEQLSDCFDESCSIQIGKLLSADHMFFGSISKLGREYVIILQMIDISTAKIIASSHISVPSEEEIDDYTDLLAQECIDQIFQADDSSQKQDKYGVLLVQTTPAGASVFIGEEYLGEAPIRLDEIIEGTHECRVELSDYQTETKQVEVVSNRINRVMISLKSLLGTIIVRSNIQADVFIAGERVGKTPYTATIKNGQYNFEVKREGYIVQKKAITIYSEQENIWDVILKSKPQFNLKGLDRNWAIGLRLGYTAILLNNFNAPYQGFDCSVSYLRNRPDPDVSQHYGFELDILKYPYRSAPMFTMLNFVYMVRFWEHLSAHIGTGVYLLTLYHPVDTSTYIRSNTLYFGLGVVLSKNIAIDLRAYLSFPGDLQLIGTAGFLLFL